MFGDWNRSGESHSKYDKRDDRRGEPSRRHSSSSRSDYRDEHSHGHRRSRPPSPPYDGRFYDNTRTRSPPPRGHHSRDEYPRSRSRGEYSHHDEEEYVTAFRKEYDHYCRESRDKLREEPFPYLRWLEINKRTPQFYEKYKKYRRKEEAERKSPLSYTEWQKYRKHVKERKAGGWSGYKEQNEEAGGLKTSEVTVFKVKKKKERKSGEALEPGEVTSSEEEEEVFVPNSEPSKDLPPRRPHRPSHNPSRPPRPPFERRDVSRPEPKKECPVVMIEPQIRDLIASQCLFDEDTLPAHPPGSIHHKPTSQTPASQPNDSVSQDGAEQPQNPELSSDQPSTSKESPIKGKPAVKSPSTGSQKRPPNQGNKGGGPRRDGPRPRNSGGGFPRQGPRPPVFSGPLNPNLMPLGPPRNPFAPPIPSDPWYGPPDHQFGRPPGPYGYQPRPQYGPDYGQPSYYPPPSFGGQYPGYGPPRPPPPHYGYGPPGLPPPHDPYGYPRPPHPYPPHEDPYYRGYGPPPPPHDPYGHPPDFGPPRPPAPGYPPAFGAPRPPAPSYPPHPGHPPGPYASHQFGNHDPYERHHPPSEVENQQEYQRDDPINTSKNEFTSAQKAASSNKMPTDEGEALGLQALKLQELMDRKRDDLFQLTRLKKNADEFRGQYNDWMSKYDVWKRENIHHPSFQSINSEWEEWRRKLVDKMKTTDEMIDEANQRIKVIDQLQSLLITGDVDPNVLKDVELKATEKKEKRANEESNEDVEKDVEEPSPESSNFDHLAIEHDEPVVILDTETRQHFLTVIKQSRDFLKYMSFFEELYPPLPPLM